MKGVRTIMTKTTNLDLSGLTSLLSNTRTDLSAAISEVKASQGELIASAVEQAKALKSFSAALLDSQKTMKETQAAVTQLIQASAEEAKAEKQQLGQIENVQQAHFQSCTTKLEQISQKQVDDSSKLDELLARVQNKPVEKGWKHYGIIGLKVLGCTALGSIATLGYQYAFGSEPQQPQLQISTQ